MSKQPTENSKKKQKVKEEKPAIGKTQETTTKGKKKIAAKESTTTEPKTDATSAVTSYTRITKKMSVAKLKEEATARHIDCKRIPRIKIDILDLLVEGGSICIHKSTEYINYQNLLKKVEKERHAFELHQAELRRQRYEKEEQKRVHAERKRQEERDLEIARQKALHVHSFPRVHPCPLAKRKELTLHGKSRPEKCNVCGYFLWNNSIYYSCESCGWDTCQRCFEQNNMTREEKEEHICKRRLIQEAQAEREREMERHRKRQQKLDEKHRKRQEEHERNAKQRFESKVIKVEGKHIDPNSGLQFLAWYSDGYDNDGWHSYVRGGANEGIRFGVGHENGSKQSCGILILLEKSLGNRT